MDVTPGVGDALARRRHGEVGLAAVLTDGKPLADAVDTTAVGGLELVSASVALSGLERALAGTIGAAVGALNGDRAGPRRRRRGGVPATSSTERGH